jgi:hypothetical protein
MSSHSKRSSRKSGSKSKRVSARKGTPPWGGRSGSKRRNNNNNNGAFCMRCTYTRCAPNKFNHFKRRTRRSKGNRKSSGKRRSRKSMSKRKSINKSK